jgi:hypothetical protein
MTFMRCCLVVTSLVVAVGCSKPKEGAACTESGTFGNGPGTCLDKQNALVCVGGKYTHVKCEKSATGCMDVAGNVSCSVIKDVGEPCPGGAKVADCSSDGKKMLLCEGGAWVMKMGCSKLCVSNVNGVRCENASGAVGDECTQDQFDSAVCSEDKLQLLVCDGKKFFAASSCRGQNKCRAVGKQIDCDTSMAEVGDPCEEDGALSCDTAKKTMLKCTAKKFVKEQDCKKRCNNAFKKFSCD